MSIAGGRVDGDTWTTRAERLRPGDRVVISGDELVIVSVDASGLRDGRLKVVVDVIEFDEIVERRELSWGRQAEIQLVSRDAKTEETVSLPKVVRGPQTKMPW